MAALVDVRRVRDPLCLGWTNGADQCRVQPDRSILCEIAGVEKKRGQIWCDKPDYERIGKVCRGFHDGCNWCERVLKVDGKWTATCQKLACPSYQSQVFPGIKCGLMPHTPITVLRK